MSKPPHIHNRETPDGEETQFAAKLKGKNVNFSVPQAWVIYVVLSLIGGGTAANYFKPNQVDGKILQRLEKLDDLEKRMGQLESAQGRLESGQALLGERIDRLADRWHGAVSTNSTPYVFGAPGL
jgi:hypothetical protein